MYRCIDVSSCQAQQRVQRQPRMTAPHVHCSVRKRILPIGMQCVAHLSVRGPSLRPSIWIPRDKCESANLAFRYASQLMCGYCLKSWRQAASLLTLSGCIIWPVFNPFNLGQHDFHLSFVSLVIKDSQCDNNLRVSLELLASHAQPRSSITLRH